MADFFPGALPRRLFGTGLAGVALSARARAESGAESGPAIAIPGLPAPLPLPEALRERCSLRAFGAKLDGRTDDSEAVARAVAFARANNVPVYHPGGPCLMAGKAAEIDTAGVAIHGIGVADFGFPYGRAGSQFLITDRERPPFLLGAGAGFQGLVFYWPEQIDQPGAPIPYPPLFSAKPGRNTPEVAIRNCQVTNAFDFLVANQKGTTIGALVVSDCRIYAIRNCFTVANVPEVLMIENNLFSYAVYGNEVRHWRGGGQRADGHYALWDYTARHGAWFFATGDGTPSRVASAEAGGPIAANNYIFGYRWGLRAQGAVIGITRLIGTHFDAVGTVLQVEPGGSVTELQMTGSLIYAYNGVDENDAAPAFSIRDPSPGVTGHPACKLTVMGCEIGFARGSLFDITGQNVSEIRIANNKLTRYANTNTPGPYHALHLDAPNAQLSFLGNDVWPAGGRASGLRIQAARWASITGNNFDRLAPPILIGSEARQVLLSGNLSADTRTAASVEVAVGARVVESGNAWDRATTLARAPR